MSKSDTFCTVPWFEVHINADGTFHTCGAQPNRISNTPQAEIYNIKNMSISDWANSDHQCRARLDKIQGNREPLCSLCYHEESVGSSSKRLRENLKIGIRHEDFQKTFDTNPCRQIFDHSANTLGRILDTRPTSYHLSLGNECNFACKMCSPTFSSRLAAQLIQENLYQGPARLNWTLDDQAWHSVMDSMCGTPNLKWVHVIGGEPLLNPRFNDMIDRLLAAGLTDIYLGFTTNGSTVDHDLLKKLQRFRHVDIGISIECAGPLNDRIRVGSDVDTVLHNIDQYLGYRVDSHVYVTVRTVPSALSVHTLDDLYRWCLSRRVDVMSNILANPTYQQIRHLPQDVKERLLDQYSKWEFGTTMPGESDPRDPTRFQEHIDNDIRTVIHSLELPNDDSQTTILYQKLKAWGWLDDPNIEKYFSTARAYN